MKIKDMVSFRAMMSTFFIQKVDINDACTKISKLRKLTSKVINVFEVGALLDML